MALHTELGSDPLFENKEEGNEDPMGASHQEPIKELSISEIAEARWGAAILGGQTWPGLTPELWEYLLQK